MECFLQQVQKGISEIFEAREGFAALLLVWSDEEMTSVNNQWACKRTTSPDENCSPGWCFNFSLRSPWAENPAILCWVSELINLCFKQLHLWSLVMQQLKNNTPTLYLLFQIQRHWQIRIYCFFPLIFKIDDISFMKRRKRHHIHHY